MRPSCTMLVAAASWGGLRPLLIASTVRVKVSRVRAPCVLAVVTRGSATAVPGDDEILQAPMGLAEALAGFLDARLRRRQLLLRGRKVLRRGLQVLASAVQPRTVGFALVRQAAALLDVGAVRAQDLLREAEVFRLAKGFLGRLQFRQHTSRWWRV